MESNIVPVPPPDGVQLAALLRALAAAERQLADAVARQLGLGLTDFLALTELLSGEPVGPVELGRRLGLQSGASTALADRLEAAGHVRRHAHLHDRRRVVVAPTDHARRQLSAHLEPLAQSLVDLAARFTPDERSTIATFLRAATELYAYDSHESRSDQAPASTER